MAEYCAADLPVGSIVATDITVAIKIDRPYGLPWSWAGPGGGLSADESVDGELRHRGAVVLRVGTGQEE